MIKKIYTLFVICFLFLTASLNSQTVQVVANPGTSGNIVCGAAAYHASESVYLASEIGTTNFLTAATAISNVSFNLSTVGTNASGTNTFSNYTIYMKEGTANKLATGKYSTAGYTKVYTGTFDASATGWVGVELTTPFTRTAGTKNLQVLIVRADGVTPGGYVWAASVGSTPTPTDSTTRRYNGATTPTTATTLAASLFREAIQFRHTPTADATLKNFVFPASSCYTSNQSVTVTIGNIGKTSAINAGQATVSLSVAGSNTFTGSTANVGSIAVGGTEDVTFSGINLNTAGANNFTAIVSFTGDGDPSNDTLRGTLYTAGIVSTFPVVEDAESPSFFVHLKGLTDSKSYWAWETAAYINQDMATTIGTSDSLYPHSGSAYYMYDSYNAAPGYSGILYSECLTIPTGSYGIGFWMSHDTLFQSSMDSMFVDVSTDRGVTWNRVQGFQRVDLSGTFDTQIDWAQNTVDLSAYAGQTVQIAFEGQSDYGNVMGVDDINIYSTLPVKYLSFKGLRSENKNRLNWVTANETDNTGFEVQRSLDGIKYEKIGFVASTFNGSSCSYSFVDPQSNNRISYYRLKQIDKNGKSSLSAVVILKSSEGSNVQLAAIYPNPVASELNLKVSAFNADKLAVVITDATGKMVANYHASVVEGVNFFEYNVGTLKAGTYYIKLIGTEGSTQTQMFEKK